MALVGLPGSGKTTFSKKLLEEKDLGMNIAHICFDELFPWFPEESEKSIYKESRIEMLNCVEKAIESCKEKTLVIVDDNNYYKSMRHKLIQLCRKYGISFGIIYFPLSLEECSERNGQRRKEEKLPEDVIRKMYDSLEIPIDCFVYSASDFGNVKEYIAEKFQNPLEKCSENREKTPMTQSQIHLFDLHLRKLVSGRMKDISEDKKTISETLNRRRREIFENLRNGKVLVESFSDLERLFES